MQMAAKAAARVAREGGAPPAPPSLAASLARRLRSRGVLSLMDGVPSAVMRAALAVPERTPESCNPSLPLPGNDSIWGFCVSVFC